ncbi:MAG: hypothetical protein DMG88_22100 [Acidobacteria bacterium]|nr:MAG: hypothetical protein DMG88_22100 [Acidobacteriota bacterium]
MRGPLHFGCPKQEARVSQVIQDVRLLEAHAAPHAAAVNDKVIRGSAVRTGVESRAELTFNDLTITRLGANTIFSFTAGARQAELTQGAILLQVPPNAPPVRANTTAVTVAVMGGTALLSTGPPAKFMVLEGTGTIYPLGHPEKAVTVRGGEMVIAEGGHVSKPEKFDVKLVLATSPLVADFPSLANLPLILAVADQQAAQQQVVVSNRPPYQSMLDTIDVTDQSATSNPAVVDVRVETPTPSPPPPPPTPSKFGTLSTITSPNPYVITSGTVITTDPSVTTNGATDLGKIYRGATDDGAFTLWAFGSTSAFDTALNIDTEFFADPNNLPIAVFKFQSLSLTGNPTIDTSNGGVTKLGLIGVDGITSGPPGGTLTFTGLDLLALATVNGSIDLTSDVSFQNLGTLAIYARGSGSDLTINSSISNIGILDLAAEGSVQLTNPGTMSVGALDATAGDNLTMQIGGSLLLNGKNHLNTLVLPGTTVANGANLTLDVTGDYANNSATELSRLRVTNEGAHIGTGGNINANIGGNLTTMSDFEAVVQNTNGQIDNGGNITLATGGSISTGGELNLLVENYNETAIPAGHIGTGGNLSLTTGGDLTADFASIAINNRGGGMIDSSVNLNVNIGGTLTTLENGPDFLENTASLSVALSTRYDGNPTGSFIGGDATLGFQADSASIGGGLSVFLSDRGGTINGNAVLNFNITHDVTITGADIPNISIASDIELLNDSGTTGVESPFGGTIHGDATLLVNAANFTLTNAAGSLFVDINNGNGGVIDSNATLSFNLSGDLTTQSSADFDILNGQNQFSNGMPGGSIGSAATLTISAVDISVGTDFSTGIFNTRFGGAPGPGAGSIGTDATLNITASNVAVGGQLSVGIGNRNNGSGSGTGGSIGGNAAINLNLLGNLGVQGDADFFLNNESDATGPGGTIGGDATINLSAANISTGGAFSAEIRNYSGGTIGGSASLNITAASIGNAGDATFQILNNDGGQIGGAANISGGTSGDLTANSITALINNRNGGTIGSGAALSFGIGGTLSTQGDATFGITNRNDGSGGGVINGDVTTDVSAANVSIGGGLLTDISTNRGGHIASAFNNVSAGSALTAQTYLDFEIENAGFDNGSGFAPGGTIDADAILDVSAGNMSTGTDYFNALISNDGGGHIGGNAIINVIASGAINAGTDAFITITNNQNDEGPPAGTIGGDAAINVTATNISTAGGLFPTIDNSGGGSIGGNANLEFGLKGDLTTQGDAIFTIDNSNGGTIGGNATIDVTATNITANSLTAQIDNTGGSIGASTEGSATINMNVSGTATVTNDATVAIYGNDAGGPTAININGGNYNVGGTFLSYMDGNGTITFSNATAHADVLKAGVFGSNGTLNIGGGMLSADTELKLYASGSNGSLNFLSNVTLGGGALTKILAANTINILDGVVVTIGGSTPADVYTNNANYTGFGGNGTTTGTFAGAGANNPQPLASAPPFGPSSPSRPNVRPANHGAENRGTINVGNTEELLALLDGAPVGPDGKIKIPGSKSRIDLKSLSRTDTNRLLRAERRMLMQQTRDRTTARIGSRRAL